MKSFVKDWLSIFISGILGAFLVRSFNGWWLFGALAGGAIGYVMRTLTEPQRIKQGLERASQATKNKWQGVTFWRPGPYFKDVVKESIQLGLIAGGICGLFINGIIMTSDGAVINPSLMIIINCYVLMHILCFIFMSLAVFFIMMMKEEDKNFHKTDNLSLWAKRLNSISIHYNLFLIWPLKGVWWLLKLVYKNLPLVKKFLIVFVRYIHCEDFYACGVYAAVLSIIVGLLVSPQPILTITACLVGAAIGAGMRRIVLRLPVFADSTA